MRKFDKDNGRCGICSSNKRKLLCFCNVLLRKKQYTLSDDPAFCLSVSQNMIAAKIQNYNNVLKRFVRDNGENPDVSEAIFKMGHRKNESFSCRSLDMLRGCEGDAANI